MAAEEEKSPDDDSMDFQVPDLDDDDLIEGDSKNKSSKKGLKLSKKQIVTLSAIVGTLLLLIIIAGVVMKMMGGDAAEEDKEDNKEAPAIILPLPEVVNILPLKPFKIPLTDDLGDWELNVTIALEVPNKEVQKEIERRSEEIREALPPILGKRSPNMLQSVTEKIALRTELIAKINKMLKSGKIKNLYFTEFVVM